jgi:hypothetical protein
MALIVVIPNDGQKQGLTLEAFLHKKPALLQRVDLAIAFAVDRIVQWSVRVPPWSRFDTGTMEALTSWLTRVRVPPSPQREIKVRCGEDSLIAFLRLTATKIHPAIGAGVTAPTVGNVALGTPASSCVSPARKLPIDKTVAHMARRVTLDTTVP